MIMKRLIHQEDKTDLIWMYLIIDSKELKLSQLNDKETQTITRQSTSQEAGQADRKSLCGRFQQHDRHL